ncbi:MAG: hypothetical protein JSW45_11875, partial [Thiotrichales bacterium]
PKGSESIGLSIDSDPFGSDGAGTGEYRHGFPGTDNRTKLTISRADVADFMLKQLTDDTYFHKTPGLSY